MRNLLPAIALLLAGCQAGDPNAGNRAETASNAVAGPGVNETFAVDGPGRPAGDPDAPVSSDDPASAPQPDSPTQDCPIIRSSDWRAHVDAMPGPNDNPLLIVTGKVTVPTGGYRIEWGDSRVAESYPVQIFADLRVIPPRGAATQVITTHDVRGEWPIDQPVGSFTVRCGNRVLARVSPVETAR